MSQNFSHNNHNICSSNEKIKNIYTYYILYFFYVSSRNIQGSNPPPLTIDLRKKKKKIFKMQNEKEFVFGKEKNSISKSI
jgi:hypothetical protein